MKKLIFALFLLVSPLLFHAQIVDFNQIIPGEERRPASFEDYLVQLAWSNNPQSKILDNNKAIANYEVDLAKWDWSDNVSAQFNLNEISLSNIIYNYEDPLFVALPIWNLTATVKLGTFIQRPKRIEIAKEKVLITENNINLLKLKIRAQVLESYRNYLLALEILKIRTQAEQEANDNYILAGNLFEQAKIDFNEFNTASNAYINAREAKANAAADVNLIKYQIEELIGIKFEDAERYGKMYKK